MSKEVIRQALEALEAGEYYIDDLEAVVYAADDLHRAVDDDRLFPDRAHGVVLGWP